MNETNYARIRAWFMEKTIRLKIFLFLNKSLPLVVFLSYFILILSLMLNRDIRIIKVILIPFVVFVLVSFIRKIINAPRPYVAMNIEPLVKRDKQGESFPSRHVLSVSVIAAACFYISPLTGIIMTFITLAIAVTRVLSGVHYIKDVVFGALTGYILGGLAFWLF